MCVEQKSWNRIKSYCGQCLEGCSKGFVAVNSVQLKKGEKAKKIIKYEKKI